MRCVFVGLCVLLTGSSCTMYAPPARKPEAGVVLPRTFKLYERGQAVPVAWWTVFNSQELNALVGKALSSNLTLAQARARLEQSAALARLSGARRLPAANVEAGASATELGKPRVAGGDTRTDAYDLSVAVSYELDLWGRVAAQGEAAAADWEAAVADLLTARLSVAAEVALSYFDLLAVRAKLDVFANQIEASRKQLQLLELRYRRGHGTGADVLRQQAALESLLSQVSPLSMRAEQLRNQIATLTGSAAGTALEISGRELPHLLPKPETGLPVDLLAQRPDIQAAGLRLDAADWSVSAARADRLPSIRLSAASGWSSDELATILDDWLARLAASLVGPLFDAGLRKAEVDRARAQADLRLAEYRQRVLVAVQEVQDALSNERHDADLVDALAVQLETTRRLYRDLERRYMKGMDTYVNVLDALESVQRLERLRIDAQAALISSRIRLHRALGGGTQGETRPREPSE